MENSGLFLRRLTNGLSVIAMPQADVETVSVGLLTGAGARLEEPWELGSSRILEYWIWDGLSTELADLGIHKKSAPNIEWTRYWVTALAPYFAQTLRTLLQAVSAPGLQERSFAAFRSLAAHQAAARENEPQACTADLLRQAMGGTQPIARSAYGRSDGYGILDPGTVRNVYERLYQPANCVLAIVGNYSEDHLEKLLDDCQNNWKGNMSSACFPSEQAPLWTPGIIAKERDANQAYLTLGIPGVPYDDADFFPLAVLVQIIGGGDGSRLYEEIRQRRGLVYQIRSSLTSFRDAGLMTIQLGSRKESVLEALEQIILELRRLERDGVTEREVQSAKNQLIKQMVMRSESTVARMNTLLTSGWYPKYPSTLEAMRRSIEGVTSAAVSEAISRHALTNSLGIASIGPLAASDLKAGAIH
ncbi:insulinase family protein [Paenibacillus sp. Marseille-P2973]|uniref:M16 family metallopeptidase n=1 Tax=Paenibacillus sp. Marseille-P2973 TaxID=1871032 RepID=UPI001B37B969|nr:pitrilysin family protein [Paenibacillus sp. Marseille-P2973]MBQ4899125.1 insulinase family protein [Paenibacillus sp. Marseille-P2973]